MWPNSELLYSQYYTLSELLPPIFTEITASCASIFGVVDGVKDTNQIASFLNVVYGDLGTMSPLWERIFSRYLKYDKTGKEIPAKTYIANLANKMYSSLSPLFQMKQFFNSSMDWPAINDLLSEQKNITSKNILKQDTTLDRQQTSDSTNEDGQYVNGETAQSFEYAPQYASTGNKGKGNLKVDGNDKGHTDASTDYTYEETKQALKFDYLKDIYEIIKEQEGVLTRYFYEFVNYISYPNQNITFEPFPWPWTYAPASNIG